MLHYLRNGFYWLALAVLAIFVSLTAANADKNIEIAAKTDAKRELIMPGTVALEFSNLKHFNQVRLIHDTVMGGRSAGLITVLKEPAGLRFDGHLSLANNGGFASAEFALAQALPAVEFRTLQLTALADGRRYQLRLKTPFIPQGVAYVAEFQSSSHLQQYQFEPVNFRGQFRGRLVTGLPALNFYDVSHISLMLADSNQGPFAIELFSIQFSALQSI